MMTRDETHAKGGTGVKVRKRRKRGTRRETAAEAMCLYCVYLIEAVRLKSWDALLYHRRVKFPLCAHHNESPGVLREVHPADKCRHFRARHKPPERVAVRQPADPSIRYIPLTHRHVTIVDAADYEWLGRYRWFTKGGASGKYYAGRSVRGQIILMHREIMKPPKGMVVDHINGNSLDNRRCNLRICTPATEPAQPPLHRQHLRLCRGVSAGQAVEGTGPVSGPDRLQGTLRRQGRGRQGAGRQGQRSVRRIRLPEFPGGEMSRCGFRIADCGLAARPRSRLRPPVSRLPHCGSAMVHLQ